MKWFLDALKNKYATFEGRARRSEYWYFMLFYFLAIVALAIVDGIAGTFSEEAEIGLFSGLFVLATIRAEPRRDGAATARHRSQRLVGPDQPRSLPRCRRAAGVHRAGQPAGGEPVRAQSEGVNAGSVTTRLNVSSSA